MKRQGWLGTSALVSSFLHQHCRTTRMSRFPWAVLLLTAVASCGAAKEGNQMADNSALTRFAMTSQDLRDGQPIPQVHSCDGADRAPQLSWGDPPAGTKSLALVMDDPDAPSGTFRHWGAYDIPATTREIAARQAVGTQATNDFGKSGYGGPCPPKGHGPHRYRFKLYALDVERLELPANAKVEQVEAEALKHEIGIAQLTGTYERK
jgi:Raf kinase inhibitor-like YbhB/YbcL family protein